MQIPYRKPGKFTSMKPDLSMTKAKYLEIEKELKELKEKQPFAAQEVARLAELGDFSENAEYQHAKGRLRGINAAIFRLDRLLSHAVIIEPKQKEVVEVGHTVTILQDGKMKSYQILGSAETDPKKGIISHSSPLGKALLGHRLGDIVKVKIGESEKEFEIVGVE